MGGEEISMPQKQGPENLKEILEYHLQKKYQQTKPLHTPKKEINQEDQKSI